MSEIVLVIAMAANGVIGGDGRIPWRVPEDMRRFKALTLGKPCIMGRKTWESLPKKPLVGRTNVVVTRDRGYSADGAVVVHSVDAAFEAAAREASSEIMVIGGAEIYAAALRRATRIDLTELHAAFQGDAKMEAFDRNLWQEIARENHVTPDGLTYSYVTLVRRKAA